MDYLKMNFQSTSLHKQTEVNVLVPHGMASGKSIPMLMLLHGMTDDHTGWIRHSLIENYAEKLGLCVVMPNADLSFYNNMPYGGDYLAFVAEELPNYLRNYIPISEEKEKKFIAGNSMGGYGALLIAMRYPELFHAAFSLSGPMKISWIYRILSDETMIKEYIQLDKNKQREFVKKISDKEKMPALLISSLLESGNITRIFKSMFGEKCDLDGSDLDLFALSEKLNEKMQNVLLYAFCGKQDYHYESNLIFEKNALEIGLRYSLIRGTGAHDWDYWNKHVPDIIREIKKLLTK